jgi:hypothetical protein
MAGMKPVPLDELLLFYAFGIFVSFGTMRYLFRSEGSTARTRQLTIGFAFAFLLGIAALDAFYNHRLGLPQF